MVRFVLIPAAAILTVASTLVMGLLLGLLLLVPPVACAEAPIYRWIDAGGQPHFSNGSDSMPSTAKVAELPPLSVIERASTRPTGDDARPPARRQQTAPCGWPDASGLAAAVARQLRDDGQLADLMVFAEAVPISYPDGAVVSVYRPDTFPRRWASVEAGVPVAYPATGPCPSQPLAVRVPVAAVSAGGPRRLCNDYQRAFAEIGVAVDRDGGVGSRFREIAETFVAIARQGYEAGGAGPGAVPSYAVARGDGGDFGPLLVEQRAVLSPWAVDTHVAQLETLARESEALVDELTVALEEIDRAARASGCW